jgi:hypothetical protein
MTTAAADHSLSPSDREPVRKLLVTSPQRRVPLEGERKPWGIFHAREDGSVFTACGLPCATWFVFWEMTFNPRDRQACLACIGHLREKYLSDQGK